MAEAEIEAMDDLFEIKLMVGGTYYPLTIRRKDERLYREAARRINDKLNRYREHFPQLSEEKYYVMAAVHIAMVNVMLEDFNDTVPYREKIRQMDKELDTILTNASIPDAE
jgi:cell division protein ZapA